MQRTFLFPLLFLLPYSLSRRTKPARTLQLQSKAFHFDFLNNSSLPLNVLVIPQALAVYAASSNDLRPGKEFDLSAFMGSYDIHVAINDGDNGWSNSGSQGWALLKDGTAVFIGVALKTGMTGKIAVTAAAAVTFTLTGWAIAPTAIIAASAATLVGVAVFSTMTVTALTAQSMDFAASRLSKLTTNTHRRMSSRLSRLGAHASVMEIEDELLFRFEDVVTEIPVREAFITSYPMLALDKVVMSKATASSYFKSMQSSFSAWRVAKGSSRQFVIGGGFMEPTPIDVDGHLVEEFVQVGFAPLALGEVHQSYGCNYANHKAFWRDRGMKCGEVCKQSIVEKNATGSVSLPWYQGGGNLPFDEWPEAATLQWRECMRSCVSPFEDALAQEKALADRDQELDQLARERTRLFVVGTPETLVAASRAAGIPEERIPEYIGFGASGFVTKLDKQRGAALLNMSHDADLFLNPEETTPLAESWFPLEALSFTQSGTALYTLQERNAPTARYGECWSTCGAKDGHKLLYDSIVSGLKQLVTIGGIGTWCYSSNRSETPTKLETSVVGRICSSQDECGNVRMEDEWHCTGACA